MITRTTKISLLAATLLFGCASAPPTSSVPPFIKPPTPVAKSEPLPPRSDQTTAKSGGYYLDDGPGDHPPANLDSIPDAVPKTEPPHRSANQPYIALGERYAPLATNQNYKARGVASWYGRRYHGKATASGETYDMYQMTGAHTTLPIPSYVRVRNLQNNKTVIVRVNDRGPFRRERLIDLSYAAAYKLGYAQQGSAEVEVESVMAGAPSAASGTYLQLGAFTTQASADSFQQKLKSDSAWPGDALQASFSGGLYRVRSGPYGSAAEARNASNRIEKATQLAPVIVVR
ncbi:MAG: septal ring lytic transglycosylase RlpA family protein [Burkholderiales bacterium]